MISGNKLLNVTKESDKDKNKINRNKLWHIINESVIGKSHIKSGLPNQDAVLTKEVSDKVILSAVADGHGSKKCFRSDLGAKFAVESAIEIGENIHSEWLKEDGELNTKKIGKYYTKKIVKKWQNLVGNHIKENAFEEDIVNRLSVDERKSIAKNPSMVYGSTLVMVLLIDQYIVCYQLGDGDILFVSKAKKVTRPLMKDKRHIANDTLSLCLNKPEREFKIRVFKDSKNILRMIVLSTDGYANSFSNDSAFQKVGSDLLTLAEEDGVECIDENLKEWLDETTELGSGDDITVSILSRKIENEI